MTDVTLDKETLDRITIAGLLDWRAMNERNLGSKLDGKNAKMTIAAIDVLLAYAGTS